MSKFVLRETALDLLTRIGENGGFSHVLLDKAIRQKELSDRDGSLLTEIVYGTLQRRDLLDFYMQQFVDKKKKLKPWVKWLLYMSLYQMKFLDKVPDHAIIHEAVELSKKRGHKGIASLVNGVLRNVQRSELPDVAEISDPIARLAVETSHPKWMVARWVDMYGWDQTREMCLANLHHKPMSIRVQPLKMSREAVIDRLIQDGYEAVISKLSPQGLIITKGNILKHALFNEGVLTVQDQSSMLAGEMLGVAEDMTVLDACSAPGGKTTHLAEKMKNQGRIYAYDLHQKKVDLVSKKAKQLGLDIIQTGQADSRQLLDKHEKETFDRILLDAPCSGLGVLRGKPDIKYHKQEKDILALSSIQDELLESVSPLLKKDGKLLYSTCTVDEAENEQVIRRFLKNHPDFMVDPDFFEELPGQVKDAPGLTAYGLQLYPQDFDTDGFFLCRLIRKP
ncbi:16S rRNA (cytosine(967)-C(5))-methyltransferase RsmB [Thalassobacillus hwangdonensis]|uniref:16S rRNA (cytosine(967)-C(5))-methyltransferase n=1 Tax=Thalassobacillus hwangdonensis TaxID=546108 RepID=A0ABW3KX43_9BACI